jgi:hypothetical protein
MGFVLGWYWSGSLVNAVSPRLMSFTNEGRGPRQHCVLLEPAPAAWVGDGRRDGSGQHGIASHSPQLMVMNQPYAHVTRCQGSELASVPACEAPKRRDWDYRAGMFHKELMLRVARLMLSSPACSSRPATTP